jgi:hypothetical protein
MADPGVELDRLINSMIGEMWDAIERSGAAHGRSAAEEAFAAVVACDVVAAFFRPRIGPEIKDAIRGVAERFKDRYLHGRAT